MYHIVSYHIVVTSCCIAFRLGRVWVILAHVVVQSQSSWWMSMTDLILLSPSEWLKPALRFCLSKHSMSMSSLFLFVVQMTNGICFETLWNVSQNFKAWRRDKRNLGIPTLLRLWNEDWRAHKTGCQGCRMAIGIVECLRVSQSFIIARQLLVPSFSIRCRRCCLRCTELIDLAFVLHHTCSILHFSPPTPWNITCSSKKIEFNTCKIPFTRSCQVASPSGLKNQGIGVGERQRGSDFGTCSKTRPSWLRWVPRKPKIPWSICIAAALPQYQVLKRNVWRWICHGHVSSVAHLELILIYFIILTARPWVCIFAPCLCRSSLTFEGVHAKTLKDLCFATSYNS